MQMKMTTYVPSAFFISLHTFYTLDTLILQLDVTEALCLLSTLKSKMVPTELEQQIRCTKTLSLYHLLNL